MATAALSISLFSPLTSHSSISHRKIQLSAPVPPPVVTRSFRSLSRSSAPGNPTNFVTYCSLESPESSSKEIPLAKKYEAFPTVMDINQIRNILPRRFPFLLVDRVIACNPGVSAVAIKNVTINDNFFLGIFLRGL